MIKMQVASRSATIDLLRKKADDQTQELSQRLEQVIFLPRLFVVCMTYCTFFLFACRKESTFEGSQHGLVLNSL